MATHDYNLANQSGASFRSDLNNALAAIQSNNSNATTPTSMVAYMLWADTNANKLKIRNSSNDGWVDLINLDGDGNENTVLFKTLTNTGTVTQPALRVFGEEIATRSRNYRSRWQYRIKIKRF